MSMIFKDRTPFPIPPNFLVNRSNGRVFISTRTQDGRRGQLVLGRAVRDEQTGEFTRMYANSAFRERYPALWAQSYGAPSDPDALHAGLYMITLALARKTGLYKAVSESLGPLFGNAVMDYAMYSIRFGSSAAQGFAAAMQGQLTFSGKAHSDAWMAGLFSQEMTEEQIGSFQKNWASACAQAGVRNVWLCLGGTGTSVSSSEPAEAGAATSCQNGKHGKDGKEDRSISFIWAVHARDGLPVAWRVHKGAMAISRESGTLSSFSPPLTCMLKGCSWAPASAAMPSSPLSRNAGATG